MTEFVRKVIKVKTLQEVINSLCTHLGDELIGVGIIEHLVLAGKLVKNLEVFFL